MKHFRRLISVLLVVILTGAMLVGVLAADVTKTIGIALTNSGDLALTCTVEKSMLTGEDNYAVITHHHADGRADADQTIAQSAWTARESHYTFSYAAYAAKEMADLITVTIYNANGAIVAQRTECVCDIVTEAMTMSTERCEKMLLEATLEYGAAAQRYFDYNTSSLEDKDLDATESTLTAIRKQLSSVRNDISSIVDDTNIIYGASCVLGNKLQLKVYFCDNSKTVYVEGTQISLQPSVTEGYYYCTVDVAAEDMFEPISLVAKDGDNVVALLTDSVASYCARLYEKADEKNTALADAILLYGMAAKNAATSQTVSEPAAAGTYTYTGTEQTLALSGFDSSYMTVTGNKQTDAGMYEATVVLNNGYKWADGADGKIAWSIEKQELSVSNAIIGEKEANGILDDAVVESVSFSGLQNGETLTPGVDYTASAAYESTESGDAVPVTVTVNLRETEKTKNYTLPNGTFQTTGKVTQSVVDKFALVFENTDQYLYRVGNKNAVELGSLFAAQDGVNVGDVAVTVTKREGTASGSYTANSDWTKSKLQFSGVGVVDVTISEDHANPLTLSLEVVDGYNTTTYSGGSYPLGNRNSVLLNDIAITADGKYSLTNATLYGNGFTFDVTAGKDSNTATGSVAYNGTVAVNNATLDNVRIVGEVFLQYGKEAKLEYNFSTVLVSGSSVIENCYISNGGSPVRTINCTSLELINTTLEGGIFANLDVRSGRVTLNNVVTINQSDADGKSTSTDRKTEAEEKVVGLGVVMFNATNSEIIVNQLTQHNNISNKVLSSGDAATLINALFDGYHVPQEFVDTDENGAKWVNTGIISMTEGVGKDQIVVNDASVSSEYQGTNVELIGLPGYLYAPTRYTNVKGEYITAGQGAIPPTATFNYTAKNYEARVEGSNSYCYYDKDTDAVLVSFDQGSSKVYDPNILTVTKYSTNLDVAVSINGVDYTGKTITFAQTGEYEVHYTYTDPFHFVVGTDGSYTAQPLTYTETQKLSVTAVAPTAKPAKFTFYGYSQEGKTAAVTVEETKVVTGSSKKTFIMPATTGSYVEAKTVEGVTVNCPVVHVDEYTNFSDYNFIYPYFLGVKIEDYANGGTASEATVIADQATTSLPSNLTVITTDKTNPGWSNNVLHATPDGKQGKITKGTYAGLYGMTSGEISTNNKTHNSYDLVGQFSYKDNMGNVFYYCILFRIPERTEDSGDDGCVTPDTRITLADGTHKRVDALDGTEQLLVWNLETGVLDAAPIMFVDSDAEKAREVVTLQFSDGTVVDVIYEHGFWDYDLNRYVYLDANAADYIGHTFAKQDGETLKKVQLTDVTVETRVTTAWSPVTVGHLCYFVNDMLSMPGGVGGLFNFFDVDPATMTYDYEAMARDIETYGLFTYEELNAVAPLSEDMFNAAGGAYLKVSLGKGNMSMEELAYMINRYSNFFSE